MTKILVTGATGFIGKNLVKRLLNLGYELSILVHSRGGFDGRKGLDIFHGNILKKDTLDDAVKGCDLVAHLAGTFFGDIYELNVLGTLNILEACVEFNVKKIVFSSSVAVYGETPIEGASEETNPSPKTPYGLSKFLAETALEYYSNVYGLQCVAVRLLSVYGPNNDKGVIHDFINSIVHDKSVTIHGEGEQIRDFLYVDDAVEGLIRAMEFVSKEFGIYNITTGVGHSLLQVVAMLRKLIKKEFSIEFMEPRSHDIKCLVGNSFKAKKELGYAARYSLYEGLQRTLELQRPTLLPE